MDPLFVDVRPASREDKALRAWIAERRRDIVAGISSVHCEHRDGDIYRGRLAELDELERALTIPPLPGADKE